METAFTPVASLAGGVMIGLAAVALMLMIGRIAGATGILAGFVMPAGLHNWAWRAAMLAGMLAAPAMFLAITGRTPEISVPVGTAALLIGGIVVGLGVSLGNGCTSGHGVCGMARGSLRSLVATLTFMATCAATVFVIRHVIGG